MDVVLRRRADGRVLSPESFLLWLVFADLEANEVVHRFESAFVFRADAYPPAVRNLAILVVDIVAPLAHRRGAVRQTIVHGHRIAEITLREPAGDHLQMMADHADRLAVLGIER